MDKDDYSGGWLKSWIDTNNFWSCIDKRWSVLLVLLIVLADNIIDWGGWESWLLTIAHVLTWNNCEPCELGSIEHQKKRRAEGSIHIQGSISTSGTSNSSMSHVKNLPTIGFPTKYFCVGQPEIFARDLSGVRAQVILLWPTWGAPGHGRIWWTSRGQRCCIGCRPFGQ